MKICTRELSISRQSVTFFFLGVTGDFSSAFDHILGRGLGSLPLRKPENVMTRSKRRRSIGQCVRAGPGYIRRAVLFGRTPFASHGSKRWRKPFRAFSISGQVSGGTNFHRGHSEVGRVADQFFGGHRFIAPPNDGLLDAAVLDFVKDHRGWRLARQRCFGGRTLQCQRAKPGAFEKAAPAY